MEDEDEELEKELARDLDLGDEDNFDESEFKKYGDDLDLPDSDDGEPEQDDEELMRDVAGEETDSDLEDYYRELGIQDEEDLNKPQKSSKKSSD